MKVRCGSSNTMVNQNMQTTEQLALQLKAPPSHVASNMLPSKTTLYSNSHAASGPAPRSPGNPYRLVVCQVCQSRSLLCYQTQRCDGCHRRHGACCAATQTTPSNALCVLCARDSHSSHDDAQSILALSRSCKGVRSRTFTDMLLHLAAMQRHTRVAKMLRDEM